MSSNFNVIFIKVLCLDIRNKKKTGLAARQKDNYGSVIQVQINSLFALTAGQYFILYLINH